jgi:hypothetical protein
MIFVSIAKCVKWNEERSSACTILLRLWAMGYKVYTPSSNQTAVFRSYKIKIKTFVFLLLSALCLELNIF